jgi:hypothetical protein
MLPLPEAMENPAALQSHFQNPRILLEKYDGNTSNSFIKVPLLVDQKVPPK